MNPKVNLEEVMHIAKSAERLASDANGHIVHHIIELAKKGIPAPESLLLASGMLVSSGVLGDTAKLYIADYKSQHPQQPDNGFHLPEADGETIDSFLKKVGAASAGMDTPVSIEPKGPPPEWETYAKSLVSHIANSTDKKSIASAKQKLFKTINDATK